jgi:hypothetical protein
MQDGRDFMDVILLKKCTTIILFFPVGDRPNVTLKQMTVAGLSMVSSTFQTSYFTEDIGTCHIQTGEVT